MSTQVTRFTDRCVDLSQKAVVGDPDPPLEMGVGDYVDGVIVALHCLGEYLDHPYRRVLDMLQRMPRIVSKLGLTVNEPPDFTTVCARKQDLKMRTWRVLLRVSALLHEFREVQAIDATELQRHKAVGSM